MCSIRTRYSLVFGAIATLISCVFCRANELLNPVEISSENGVCDVVLEAVVRTQPFPAAGDKYNLRSPVYVLRMANGKERKDDANCLVDPTLRVKRGDLLRICIQNRLDRAQLPAEIDNPPDNYPQEFYITNLHTHGLHVSPKGRADNVYVSIMPGEDHQSEYRIPYNHPPGTFWYHPHRHGSVAFQLASGMAGALIVEGDHDALGKGNVKPYDRILVLQQIHGTKAGNLISLLPGDIYDKIKSANSANAGTPVSQLPWRAQKAARVRQRAAQQRKPAAKGANVKDNPPDPQTAPSDIEYTLVNGEDPQNRTITMFPGEVQRWRFVHAGIDEVINLAVLITGKDGKPVLDKNSNPVQVPFYEISVDGIPRVRKVKIYQKYLYPAYRVDVLFRAPLGDLPDGNKLVLYDATSPGRVTLNGSDTIAQPIATIQLVTEKKNVGMELPDDESLSQTVPVEFRSGIPDREVDNRRWHLRFNFADNQPSRFLINGHEYAMDRIDRHVRLDTAEEWLLKSDLGTKNFAGHPFHIHVNPFVHYVYEGARSLQGFPPGVSIRPGTLLTQLRLKPMETVMFTGKLPSGEPFTSTTPVTDKATLGELASNLLKALNAKTADGYRVDFVENGLVLRSFLCKLDDLTIDQTCTPDFQTLCFAPATRQVVDLIWRDTLMAPSTGPAEAVRMRFRDYTGDTVLHCHIVDHEDQGMMKNIRILPAGNPGPDAGEKKRESQLTSTVSAAPEFSLPDAAGKVHSLAELADRPSVLIFFRGQACLQCNTQLNSFARFRERFAELGVNLVAVSSTGAHDLPGSQGVSPAEQPLPFLLLADAKREAFKRYGCIDASDSPLHGTFVLDRRGRVFWSDIGMEPYLDVERVLAELVRLGS